jgi:hypothetical protein
MTMICSSPWSAHDHDLLVTIITPAIMPTFAAVPASLRQHYDVTAEHLLAFGLCARAGDALVVRPGHPTAPVVLIRHTAGQWRGVAYGHENADALEHLVASGALQRWGA